MFPLSKSGLKSAARSMQKSSKLLWICQFLDQLYPEHRQLGIDSQDCLARIKKRGPKPLPELLVGACLPSWTWEEGIVTIKYPRRPLNACLVLWHVSIAVNV